MKVQILLAIVLAALVGGAIYSSPPVDAVAQEAVLAGNSPARDTGKGASLMAEARKTVGGEDKLRTIKTLQAKGAFRRTMGSNQLEGDVEVLIQVPDKMRRNEDVGFAGGPTITATQVINGNDVWDENSGGNQFRLGPGGFGGGGGRGRGGGFGGGFGGDRRGGGSQAADGDQGRQGRGNIDPEQLHQLQLRQRKAELSRLMIAWLLTTSAPVAWIGTAESPDGKADLLEIGAEEGGPTRLFLDSSSHLPLMMTWQGVAPQFILRRGGPGRANAGATRSDDPGAQSQGVPAAGEAPDRGPAPDSQGQGGNAGQPRRGGPPQQATLRLTLADYKTVNGISLPHTMTRGVNGQTNEEWTISSYKINPSFKSNTFTK